MESLLEKHKDNSVIKTIYFPVELSRVIALLQGNILYTTFQV